MLCSMCMEPMSEDEMCYDCGCFFEKHDFIVALKGINNAFFESCKTALIQQSSEDVLSSKFHQAVRLNS